MRPRQVDIIGAATSAGRFSLLIRAIKAAGLVDTLRGGGPFTLFAPTDAAFTKVPAYRLETLLTDPEELADTLRSHVVPGRILAADVIRYRNSTSRTLDGRPVSVAARSGRIYYGGALVSRTDILASNGVIHELEEVLLLDTASVVWIGAM
ncbi:MAG TPA: fasciclin domain-containing protein [Gemmatimonadaceae bacterium]|jgi:uncharacterized surface protein with fasciclin (FAS1) repeats|nr:fasciclin domain-containing protein [Gemmatimonadaceae bacterium]